MRETPPSLASSIADALKKDYLLCIIVTSQTRGKHSSVNLPYGLGKSSFMLELAFKVTGGRPDEYQDAYSPAWEEVFSNLFYWPSQIVEAIVPRPGKKVVPKACIAWDAVQMSAGAENSVPTVIRKLASYLSEVRPEVKVILMSAPNISSIAAPLRRIVAFEIIIWDRGCYEVQKISARKNFKNPRDDKLILTYIESARKAFGPLPESVQKRYDDWRAKMKIPARRELLKSLERYENKGQDDNRPLTDEEKEERSQAGRMLAHKRWNKPKA